MPFTYTWQTINASQTDADSPLDTTLMEAMRQDFIHLREWMGMSYYAGAAPNHDHDGVNSKTPVLADGSVTTAKIAASAITGAKISKAPSYGYQSIADATQWTPAAGVYQPVAIQGGQVVSSYVKGLNLELYVNAGPGPGWKLSAIPFAGGIVYCDGTNMRFNNAYGTTIEVYYQTC